MVGRVFRPNHQILLKTVALLCFVFLVWPAEARSAQKTLLDVTDRLYVYSTDDEALLD